MFKWEFTLESRHFCLSLVITEQLLLSSLGIAIKGRFWFLRNFSSLVKICSEYVGEEKFFTYSVILNNYLFKTSLMHHNQIAEGH